MVDIIESGTWAKLSVGARTLYPVLLKFSDQNFKHVWPSTKTLLELTGFRTKKSIIEAKKDLILNGLIQTIPGSGHQNSQYYFSFNYPGSKITPQWCKNPYHGGGEKGTSGVTSNQPQGENNLSPNHINITITNNQNQKPEKTLETSQKRSLDSSYRTLIEDFGTELFTEAYEIAKKKGLETQIPYIRAICRDKVKQVVPKNRQDFVDTPISFGNPWASFLIWAKTHLTASSYSLLESIQPEIDGKTILLQEPPTIFLKQVIHRYFQEKFQNEVYVLFLEKEAVNQSRITA